MTGGRSSLPAGRRGSFALEFALVAPCMLILLIGLIDLGRMFGDQHALDEGVSVAARYAVVNSASATVASIKSQFMQSVQPVLGNCTGCTFAITFTPSYQPGATVTVSATYAWAPSVTITLMAAQSLASATTLTVQN
jgi:Flp pilus assembly protein TadG